MNLTRDGWFRGFSFPSQRALWIQRDDGEIILGQVSRGDAFNVIERHFLDGIEIMPAEIEIAREQPVRADVRGLATHGRERVEMMTQCHLLRLFQFIRSDAGLFHLINNAQRQLLCRFAFLRIDSGVDPK